MSDLPIRTGINGLPKIILSTPTNARAEVYLNGGHITSWIPAGGPERLFLSPASEFAPGASIRGGVPVIFPQFGGNGPLPKHGFARRMAWEPFSVQAGAGGASVGLRLRDSAESRAIWPQAFLCELVVRLAEHSLEMELSISNPGESLLACTAALHTYLSVADITQTQVIGLGGAPYLDTVGTLTERIQTESELAFHSEVDRIYWNAPDRLEVREPTRGLTIEKTGFPHAVVWNPWIDKCAAFTDMLPDDYLRMLCVEAVATGSPLVIPPGQRWSGTQKLSA